MDTKKITSEINANIAKDQATRRSYVAALLVSDDVKDFISRNLPAVKKLINNAEGGLITNVRYVRIDWDFQLDTYQSGWITLLLGIYAEIYGIEQDVYFDYRYSGITDDQLAAKKYSLKDALETIFSGKDVEVAENGADVNPMN